MLAFKPFSRWSCSQGSLLQLMSVICLHTSVCVSVCQEVGVFPLAALMDVGSSNLNRVERIWLTITSHLSEVSATVKLMDEPLFDYICDSFSCQLLMD